MTPIFFVRPFLLFLQFGPLLRGKDKPFLILYPSEEIQITGTNLDCNCFCKVLLS
jgi:hypothetical protein